MNLLPDANERQIIESASEYLARSFPVDRLHTQTSSGLSTVERRQMAELGWFGVALPEDRGGIGLSAVEEMLFFREAGRALLAPGALLISLAARVAVGAGDTELSARLIAGDHGVALAMPLEFGAQGSPSRLFEYEGSDFVLRLDADKAALLPLPGESMEPLPCLDKSVSMAMADLSSLDSVVQWREPSLLAVARLGTAAMLTGIAEAVLARITDYARIRETFGRPIGAYQAVRHPCADMAVRAEVAKAQLFYAAVSLRDGNDDALLQIDAAKLLANEAAVKNCDWNIQLHGGIATTAEHDAHLFFKRARLLSRWFGSDKALQSAILPVEISV